MIILVGSAILGLNERIKEIKDHHLVLGQQEVGVDSEAGLVEKLGGEDVDHFAFSRIVGC